MGLSVLDRKVKEQGEKSFIKTFNIYKIKNTNSRMRRENIKRRKHIHLLLPNVKNEEKKEKILMWFGKLEILNGKLLFEEWSICNPHSNSSLIQKYYH